MPTPKFYQQLKEVEAVSTAHGTGIKQVFLKNEDLDNSVTQVAYGTMQPGEGCEEHIHKTMDEFFFFLKGRGTYTIENVDYELSPNTFLRIEAGKNHSLMAKGDQPLEFVYWGVATD